LTAVDRVTIDVDEEMVLSPSERHAHLGPVHGWQERK